GVAGVGGASEAGRSTRGGGVGVGGASGASEAGGGTGPAVRFAGGGRFGRGRFTIVWAGLGGDLDGLGDLAGVVRRRLRAAKLPYDQKPFRPHLTLARPGDRLTAEAVAADLAALRAYEGPMWTVESVRLMRSHLGPHPRYDTLLEAG